MLPTEKDSAGWSAESAGERQDTVSLPAGASIRRPFRRDGGTGRQTGTLCVVSWDRDSEAAQ